MSQAMKDAIKKKLTTVREETVRVLNGLTEDQWQALVYSDEGAEWRVIDVVRHVADSERGMTALMAQVQAHLASVENRVEILIPHSAAALHTEIRARATVLSEFYTEAGCLMEIQASPSVLGKLLSTGARVAEPDDRPAPGS